MFKAISEWLQVLAFALFCLLVLPFFALLGLGFAIARVFGFGKRALKEKYFKM